MRFIISVGIAIIVGVISTALISIGIKNIIWLPSVLICTSLIGLWIGHRFVIAIQPRRPIETIPQPQPTQSLRPFEERLRSFTGGTHRTLNHQSSMPLRMSVDPCDPAPPKSRHLIRGILDRIAGLVRSTRKKKRRWIRFQRS